MNIFWYILLVLLAFFPIVLWGYSFAFISDNPLNKKRFGVGILAGILSVLPIIYMEKILSFFSVENFHVFYFASQIHDIVSSMYFSFSLGVFLLVIASISFFWGLILVREKKHTWLYIKNVFLFLGMVLAIGILFFCMQLLPYEIPISIDQAPVFSWIFFSTLKLIIFYYIIVAFVEEASKHLNFLQTSAFEIRDVKSGVESAIFVALGFSFIENILYLYNYVQLYSIGGELFQLYFFRSIFAVIVHVTCSSIVAYYFSKAYLQYEKSGQHIPFIKIFLLGVIGSIFLHLVYDVALTLGFSIVLFLYFIGWYLYVSSIFYREE